MGSVRNVGSGCVPQLSSRVARHVSQHGSGDRTEQGPQQAIDFSLEILVVPVWLEPCCLRSKHPLFGYTHSNPLPCDSVTDEIVSELTESRAIEPDLKF